MFGMIHLPTECVSEPEAPAAVLDTKETRAIAGLFPSAASGKKGLFSGIGIDREESSAESAQASSVPDRRPPRWIDANDPS
jgi:hypothetical protein